MAKMMKCHNPIINIGLCYNQRVVRCGLWRSKTNRKQKSSFSFGIAYPLSFETLLHCKPHSDKTLWWKSLMFLRKIFVMTFQCVPEQIPC